MTRTQSKAWSAGLTPSEKLGRPPGRPLRCMNFWGRETIRHSQHRRRACWACCLRRLCLTAGRPVSSAGMPELFSALTRFAWTANWTTFVALLLQLTSWCHSNQEKATILDARLHESHDTFWYNYDDDSTIRGLGFVVKRSFLQRFHIYFYRGVLPGRAALLSLRGPLKQKKKLY